MSPNAEESFHPLLPRLKKDGEVTAIARAGQWMKRDPTELQKLSVSLKVDKMEFLVNSIPDIWARPILFEMALYDRDY